MWERVDYHVENGIAVLTVIHYSICQLSEDPTKQNYNLELALYTNQIDCSSLNSTKKEVRWVLSTEKRQKMYRKFLAQQELVVDIYIFYCTAYTPQIPSI